MMESRWVKLHHLEVYLPQIGIDKLKAQRFTEYTKGIRMKHVSLVPKYCTSLSDVNLATSYISPHKQRHL